MVFTDEERKIGQKYIQAVDFDLGAYDRQSPINHSYLGKNGDDNWQLFVNSRKEGLKQYTINQSGLLEEQEVVSTDHKIDEVLYFFSGFTFLLALPILPLLYLSSALSDAFGLGTFESAFPVLILLSGLTFCTLFFWKRNEKKLKN